MHATIELLIRLWLIATVTFWTLRILPGDPIATSVLLSGGSSDQVDEYRHLYGLDRPLWQQYVDYLFGLMLGEMGQSFQDGQAVHLKIAQHFQPTLILACLTLLVATLIGVILGWLSAFYALPRHVVRLSLSMPIYWTGTLVLYFFTVLHGPLWIKQWLLPVGILGFHTSGSIARVVHFNVQDMRRYAFITTAHAKGLSASRIHGQHIFPNLLPILLPTMALQMGFLLSGVVIVESLFSRSGLGQLLFNAVLRQDYPLVQGISLVLAMMFTLTGWIADRLVTTMDPRIREW